MILIGQPMLPMPGWKRIATAEDGYMFQRHDGLKVITSQATEADGRIWLHVSCSRKRRLPSWVDLAAVKHLFIGDDRPAYQVLPEQARWVNIHTYCLHLFATVLVGDNPMPDFTRGSGSI